MVVNQTALNGINVGFKTIFNKVFDGTQPLYTIIATVVPSEAAEEQYKWLGKIPSMREWIGDREIQNLQASDYTIKNKDFELTIGIDRNDIEDDRIGVYTPVISDMAQSAAEFPDKLCFGLLKNGFNNNCYDGKPFFSSDHKANRITYSNLGRKKLSIESYADARSRMMSLTDGKGNSLNITPNLLVVPPSLEKEGLKILKADLIDGSTNVYKDSAELLVVPDLSGNESAWYLLNTKKAIKPIIYQVRKAPVFVSLTRETDENVFLNKQFLYGVDSRSNAGYGFWQMAFGSTGMEA